MRRRRQYSRRATAPFSTLTAWLRPYDPQRDMFGFPRLRRLIAHHSEEERSLGNFLLEELYTFVGEGWEQEDDITLLTLKRSASLR